ncbi:MAG: hypothetical protein ACWA5T_03540 [Parvularcula sp.]
MKQLMIDMMSAMMPYMMYPVWIGGAALALGAILLLSKLFTRRGPGLGLMGVVLIALGIFYLACQGMGIMLGMSPQINFGNPEEFEFKMVEFWIIGAAFLVPGLAYKIASGSR